MHEDVGPLHLEGRVVRLGLERGLQDLQGALPVPRRGEPLELVLQPLRVGHRQAFDELAQDGFPLRPLDLVGDLAVDDDPDAGNALDAELLRKLRRGGDIAQGQGELALVLGREALEGAPGVRRRGHLVVQKSRMTGTSRDRSTTSDWNDSRATSKTFGLASMALRAARA